MHSKLVLVIAPDLEEQLVDLLLEQPDVSGFTCVLVQGNGNPGKMSLAEQVSGRRRRLRIEVVLPTVAVAALLERLRGGLAPDTVYWIESVSGFGKLGELAGTGGV
jgi:hypothetical protein